MSKLIDVKTADLVRPALDWALAKTEGFTFRPVSGWNLLMVYDCDQKEVGYIELVRDALLFKDNYSPSSGGRETACRAIVADKLGDVISVPAELLP